MGNCFVMRIMFILTCFAVFLECRPRGYTDPASQAEESNEEEADALSNPSAISTHKQPEWHTCRIEQDGSDQGAAIGSSSEQRLICIQILPQENYKNLALSEALKNCSLVSGRCDLKNPSNHCLLKNDNGIIYYVNGFHSSELPGHCKKFGGALVLP